MAMPRYRYAIGQAPVRFPSPAPTLQAEDDKENDFSMPHTESSQTRGKQGSDANRHRDEANMERFRGERRKTKSMYASVHPSSEKLSASVAQNPSGRSHKLSTASIESFTLPKTKEVKSLRGADERSLLCSKERDMMQRPSRASISCSSRPSSLFWTCPTTEEPSTSDPIPKQDERLPKSSSAYGAIEIVDPVEDDPYGYRALAGPALLPTYHEQQQKQQQLKEVNRRTCGPFRAMLKKRSLAVTVLIVFIVVAGVIIHSFL